MAGHLPLQLLLGSFLVCQISKGHQCRSHVFVRDLSKDMLMGSYLESVQIQNLCFTAYWAVVGGHSTATMYFCCSHMCSLDCAASLAELAITRAITRATSCTTRVVSLSVNRHCCAATQCRAHTTIDHRMQVMSLSKYGPQGRAETGCMFPTPVPPTALHGCFSRTSITLSALWQLCLAADRHFEALWAEEPCLTISSKNGGHTNSVSQQCRDIHHACYQFSSHFPLPNWLKAPICR